MVTSSHLPRPYFQSGFHPEVPGRGEFGDGGSGGHYSTQYRGHPSNKTGRRESGLPERSGKIPGRKEVGAVERRAERGGQRGAQGPGTEDPLLGRCKAATSPAYRGHLATVSSRSRNPVGQPHGDLQRPPPALALISASKSTWGALLEEAPLGPRRGLEEAPSLGQMPGPTRHASDTMTTDTGSGLRCCLRLSGLPGMSALDVSPGPQPRAGP